MRSIGFQVILFFTAISILGIALIPRLRLNFISSPEYNSLTVNYTYPDASAEIVESRITVPIEGALNNIIGVYKTYSEIKVGAGFTKIEVDADIELDLIRFKVAQAIRQLYPSFPREAGYPTIQINHFNKEILDHSIVSYSYNGTLSRKQLYKYAQGFLVPMLSAIEGVHDIRLQGAQKLEYQIGYNESLLRKSNLELAALKKLLNQRMSNEGLSYVFHGQGFKYARIEGSHVEALSNSVVGLDTIGSKIPLDHLIKLDKVESKPNNYYRINGLNSITLNFIPKVDANHLLTSKRIHHFINENLENLPSGTKLTLRRDSTDYITDELDKIRSRTFWSLSALLLFILIVYRSPSKLWMIIFCVTANFSIALIFYYVFKIQLNLYALAGITVSFGIIIDNIIVVSHHYENHKNLKVGYSILTASLTTMMSLVVIFVLPEGLQQELAEFAKVLFINIAISILVSLILVPAILDYYNKPTLNLVLQNSNDSNNTIAVLRKKEAGKLFWLYRINKVYKELILKICKIRYLVIVFMILLFGLPMFLLPEKIEDLEWYNKSIGSKRYQEVWSSKVDNIFGGTLRLFMNHVYEKSNYRTPQQSQLYLNASLPLGCTLDQLNALVISLESYISQFGYKLDSFVSQITSGQQAQIKITFPASGSQAFPTLLRNKLLDVTSNLGGVEWSIYGVGKGFNNYKNSGPPRFEVIVKGYNMYDLDYYAETFADLLKSHPRVKEVDTEANIQWWEKDNYQFLLDIDSWGLVTNNWSLQDLSERIRSYHVNGEIIGESKDNLAIRLKNTNQSFKDVWNLLNSQESSNGNSLELGGIAALRKEKLANSIHKEDQQYIKKISYEFEGMRKSGRYHLSSCITQIEKQLPLGFSINQFTGENRSQDQRKQLSLLLVVILAIFFISVIHFESFKLALIIISLIPLSFIGIFLTFYWFNFPFDQGGYTSFLLLSGLVVNSLIFILTDYSNLRMQFPNRKSIDLYLRAFRQKVTPISLTIISTAIGLIPFTLHGDQEVFWFSLAVGTIGGLVFSFGLIIFFIPLLISDG